MDKQLKVFILIAVMVILFLGWHLCPENDKIENFQTENNLLLQFLNHQIYLKMYIYCVINQLPNRQEMLEKLLQTQDNMAIAICQLYSQESYIPLATILRSIMISTVNFAANFKEDDVDRNRSDYYNIIKRTSITRLYQDIDRLCTYIAKISGKDFTKLHRLYTTYFKYVNNMIVAYPYQLFDEEALSTEKANEAWSKIYDEISKK